MLEGQTITVLHLVLDDIEVGADEDVLEDEGVMDGEVVEDEFFSHGIGNVDVLPDDVICDDDPSSRAELGPILFFTDFVLTPYPLESIAREILPIAPGLCVSHLVPDCLQDVRV